MVNRRDKLLETVDNGNLSDLISFVAQCEVRDLGEVFTSCSRKQQDHVWERVYSMVSAHGVTQAQPDDHERADIHDDNEEENSVTLSTIVQCLTSLISSVLPCTDTLQIPQAMVNTAALLQDLLPRIPVDHSDKLWNSTAGVFETWWKKNLPSRERLIMASLVFLVQRTLDLKPRPLVCDLKRVWSLHEAMGLVDFTCSTSAEFLSMLLRCFISPLYLSHDEGIKFLSYVMTLDEGFTAQIHSTVKNNILSTPNSWHEKYGEVYFRAWQGHEDGARDQFERTCIQDIMHHAVHAQLKLFPPLKRFLGYIHGQKKQKGMDEMLCRLYGPIMWRSLRVANSQVRSNTASLFFDVFPLQGTDAGIQEADAFLQKQFDMLQELLEDPYPHVRSLSVLGVFRIMRDFWEVIPQETLKNLTVKLIHDMLNDASSSDVRESVIKGLTVLLENPLCHPFLKPLLPEIHNHFHDVSESVRIAMLNLLCSVKSLRTIKYWNIVPLEHLLARLVIDSEPVNKRIVKLIFSNFVPIEATNDVKVSRCVMLIETNPAAARQFYRYAKHHMNIDDIVSYITMLCKAVLYTIKRAGASSSQPQDDSGALGEDGNDDNEQEEDDPLRLENTPVMLGLCETMCILWAFNVNTLKKASNADLNKTLMKKFSYALPEMFQAFTDSHITDDLLQLAGFLPPKHIPTISRSWVPRLRRMTSDNTEEEYGTLVECLCKTGQVASVMELITDWLQPTLNAVKPNEDRTGNKKKKSRPRVGFVEQTNPQPGLGVAILGYMLGQIPTQGVTLTYIQQNPEYRDLLRKSMDQLTEVLEGRAPLVNENLLVETFSRYCKLLLLLHGQDQREFSCVPGYVEILAWADKHAVPVLGVKNEHGQTKEGQSQLAVIVLKEIFQAFNNMFLIGVGETLGVKVADFCTACLANDSELELLSSVMLCMYQLTELAKYHDLCDPSDHDDEDDPGNQGDKSASGIFPAETMSTALGRVFVNIAGYVKHHPTDCHKVLDGVKTHMTELLLTVSARSCLDDTVLHDVMATIMAAVWAELVFYSRQDDLEEESHITTLPPLASWMVDILARRQLLLKYFMSELHDCCDTGNVSDLYSVHGAVHLMTAVVNDYGRNVLSLKELWTMLLTQTDTLTNSLAEEDLEDLKSVRISVETKLKLCQEALGMVPP
ncbi:condensin-2 complex subunit G2-like [Mya arenaria]|uniref:condensin-2 complex subunit G2-like n=1 Tax=Mya arenaria TaxID=6604 RepID=UPI0022E732AC|nr:condensin-2 complex subunit G2-like [Mya arenaria]XP_052803389.1 condensin-2 complex subunit G2-like [Mya arenaria]